MLGLLIVAYHKPDLSVQVMLLMLLMLLLMLIITTMLDVSLMVLQQTAKLTKIELSKISPKRANM